MVATAMIGVMLVGGLIYFLVIVPSNRPQEGGNKITERFLTEKIQADKKANIVVFSKENADQTGFLVRLAQTQQLVKDNNFTESPQLVRPDKNTGSNFERNSLYKICTPDNTSNCLYFLVTTRIKKSSGGPTTSASKVEAYSVFQTEAEAVQAYDAR